MTTAQQLGWPIPCEDPYPALSELRDAAPLHWLSEAEVFLVVSYEAAQAVLNGPGWSSDPTRGPRAAARRAAAGLFEAPTKNILLADPPDHARLRAALTPFFGPRAVESLRARVAELARTAWAALEADDSVEVMSQVAYALPLAVMCELMDIPAELAVTLRDETSRLVAVLDPLAEPADLMLAAASAGAMMFDLAPLVVERRRRPGPDLLSHLAGSTELEADEVVLMAMILAVAGHETTANLIGNGIVALCRHPADAETLRDHPESAGTLVEELIRYDGPVQLLSRIALRDQSVSGVEVPAGAEVLVSLGGANRDPSMFTDPDRLDPGRHPRHLGFGYGTHFCAGAWLARLEAQEVLKSLVEVRANVERWDLDLVRAPNRTFRRLDQLRLRA